MSLRRIVLIVVLLALAVLGALLLKRQLSRPGRVPQPPARGEFALTSPAFPYGGVIPREYTADGADISPALRWHNVPKGTVSFALVMEDPDAPGGNFTHWLICELSARRRVLPAGVPKRRSLSRSIGAEQGLNDFNRTGYSGPAPPEPGQIHHYFFTLYALDTETDLTGGFSKHQLRAARNGHVLAKTELMGKYAR